MNFLKQYGWNIYFLILALTTASLELYALWFLLGYSPYILIALLVCPFKAFILLNTKGLSGFLLASLLIIITMFFSIQVPFSSILNSQKNVSQVNYYKSIIERTSNEYKASLENYQSLKKTYDTAIKANAWGILRDFDKNNKLSVALQESNQIKNLLQKYENDLLSYNDSNNNWYGSFFKLLVIILAEIGLIASARKVKFKIEKNELIEDVIIPNEKPNIPTSKPKRKYNKRNKIDYSIGI